jgi:lysophospholipase L1-like esterase
MACIQQKLVIRKSPTRFLRSSGNVLKTDRLIVLAAVVLFEACRSATVSPVPPATPATPPRLSATKFVAFGDSITEGFVERCPGSEPNEVRPLGIGFFLVQGRAQPSPTAYPAKLQALLEARYPSQMITVINEGQAGEDIERGVVNLPRVLTANMPQVLLLQEGINTLNERRSAGIPIVVDDLRTMIQEARSRSITVFAGTLLPQRAGGCRAYDYSQEFDDIIEANVQIRRMIGTEGAVLVDLYQVFNGHTALLLGEDGLHPSAAGYEKIAEAFFAAIKKHLES